MMVSIPIPEQWHVDGIDATRQAINALPPQQTPLRASLVAGPSLLDLTRTNEAASRLLSEEIQEICSLPAHRIVQLISQRELTAVQVTEAFLTSSAIAHQATGCFSDFFPEEARARARELDAKQARGEPLGILHGLPVSIKGHILLANHRNQNGFVVDMLDEETYQSRLKERSSSLHPAHLALLKARGPRFSTEDGLLAKILRDQGVVFFCKTTMPQSVMQLDTRSVPFGQTLNPHNLALSAGGSSGGEAALLAAKGSPLGVGTDIGGSVRQPCAVNGLWGLKPTCGRLPSTSSLASTPGNTGVGGTIGPMCRSLEDIDLFMAAVLQGEPWRSDHNTFRLPWRTEIVKTPRAGSIRLGILKHDNVVSPITPIRRALSEVIAGLADSKRIADDVHVELVEVDVGDLHLRAWDLIRSLYYMDGGLFTRSLASLGEEPLLPLTEFILSTGVKERTAHEIWELTLKREALKKEYLAWWNSIHVDAMLCPAAAIVAPRPGTIRYWGYTATFNLFDLPTLVFPTGHVVNSPQDAEFEQRESIEGKENKLRPEGKVWDEENREEYIEHKEVYQGAPVGLQLVGRRFEEEELLQIMTRLREILAL